MSNLLLNDVIDIPMPIEPMTRFDNTLVEGATEVNQQVFSNVDYDRKTYRLDFSALSRAERDLIKDFYNTMQGGFDTFLFNDPTSDVLTLENIGTGTGAEDEFQITQSGFDRWNFPDAMSFYDNAVLKATPGDYAIATVDNGLLTTTYFPAGGNPLTISGNVYRRYRFMDDGWTTREFNINNISTVLFFQEILQSP